MNESVHDEAPEVDETNQELAYKPAPNQHGSQDVVVDDKPLVHFADEEPDLGQPVGEGEDGD